MDDECRSFQHGLNAFCPNCNFVPETSSAAKTVQLKHERKAGPLIGYLKRFYPVRRVRAIFYFIEQSFLLGFRTDKMSRNRKNDEGIGSLAQSTSSQALNLFVLCP